MKFIEGITEKEYEEFVSHHQKSHFLQSYSWGKVCKQNRWIPFFVGIKKKNKLVATALLLKKQLPFGFSYFYIPRGYVLDYDDYELLEFFTREIKKFTRKHKSIFFRMDPDIKLHTIDKDANVIGGENNYKLVNQLNQIGFKRKKLNKFFENQQPRFTFRINLDSEENVNKKYSKTVHRFIKKSNFYNVETYVGNKKEISEFVRLMKMTEKRQGFYSHDEQYYEMFYDVFKEKNQVELMLAKINLRKIINNIQEEILKFSDNDIVARNKKIEEKKYFESKLNNKEEVIVSAYLTVFYGNKAWYLYGANDMDFKNTLANYKLFDFQIKTALNKGVEIFDEFGTIGEPNSDSNLSGLHEFKKKFGGEYTEFIGEFDCVTNPILYFGFTKLIPFYRKFIRFFLRRKVKK